MDSARPGCKPLDLGQRGTLWPESRAESRWLTLSFDCAAVPQDGLQLHARYRGCLRVFEALDRDLKRGGGAPWRRIDELHWPGDEPFRLFTTRSRYWFLDDLGHLVWTPREGEEGREVTAAWAADAEHPVLATILDQDHERGLVFCRGQYLELTDELKIVPEPATGWPQPDPAAEPLEQLLTYLKWLPAEP